MILANRLRVLRESKNLTQGVIEDRTGLLRCYVSRVENGLTVPGLETVEKLARALEVPVYRRFMDGAASAQIANSVPLRGSDKDLWGNQGEDRHHLRKLLTCLSRMSEGDRKLSLGMAQKIALRTRGRNSLTKGSEEV